MGTWIKSKSFECSDSLFERLYWHIFILLVRTEDQIRLIGLDIASHMRYHRYMKARCPTNPSHARFMTVVVVKQEWEVTADGELVKPLPGDLQRKIEPHACWWCLECGSMAKVEMENKS